MFNFAIERHLLTSTPCATVKAPAKENQRDRCLSMDEIRAFWTGLERAPMAEATWIALKLQLVTAQRKGEILGAEWSEIDLTSGCWVIPEDKAKNAIQHRVPLSALALQLLTDLKKISQKSKWLFPSETGKTHLRGESVDKAVRRSDDAVFKAAGIKHFTPHDLRRTAATHMTSIGIPRLIVSKILNHADSGITAIYDRHSYDTEKRHALERWETELNRIINDIKLASNIIQLEKIV